MQQRQKVQLTLLLSISPVWPGSGKEARCSARKISVNRKHGTCADAAILTKWMVLPDLKSVWMQKQDNG